MIQTEVIDEALKRNGHSRRSMARLFGIPTATFNQYILGNNPMPDRVVYKLCEQLNLNPIQIDPEIDARVIFEKARKDIEAKYKLAQQAKKLGLHIVEDEPLEELARLMHLKVETGDTLLLRAVQLVEELANSKKHNSKFNPK